MFLYLHLLENEKYWCRSHEKRAMIGVAGTDFFPELFQVPIGWGGEPPLEPKG